VYDELRSTIHVSFFLYNQGFNNLVADGIIKYVIRSTVMVTPRRSLSSNGRVSVNCLIGGIRLCNSTKRMLTVTITILWHGGTFTVGILSSVLFASRLARRGELGVNQNSKPVNLHFIFSLNYILASFQPILSFRRFFPFQQVIRGIEPENYGLQRASST
jgi:hypothetical protein